MVNDHPSGNPIRQRICFHLTATLVSPLLIGSGKNEQADMEALLNASGEPFIPATAFAGAFRQYLHAMDENAERRLFGWQPKEKKNFGWQSRLFFYDANLYGAGAANIIQNGAHAKARLGIRDGVKLNACKTAEAQSKYDMLIVEAGAQGVIRFELIIRESHLVSQQRDMELIRVLCMALASGDITIGAKGRRGFGKLAINSVEFQSFDLTKKGVYDQWLDWDWQDLCPTEKWNRADLSAPQKLRKESAQDSLDEPLYCLRVPLQVKNTLLIRQYNRSLVDLKLSSPETGGNQATIRNFDYVQLKSAGKSVIPGSSWSGAIRGRIVSIMQELAENLSWEDCQQRLDAIFGTWVTKSQQAAGQSSQASLSLRKKEKPVLRASFIRIEESPIAGGTLLPIARTAIDRFTGGALHGALFEEQVQAGGKTELVLRWPKKLPKEFLKELPIQQSDNFTADVIPGLLLWAVLDLCNGLLAVGGETAVGRGIFELQRGTVAGETVIRTKSVMLGDAPLFWLEGETPDNMNIVYHDAARVRKYFQAAAAWCRMKIAIGGGSDVQSASGCKQQ